VAATGRKVPKRDGCHGGPSSGLANSPGERGDYHEKIFLVFALTFAFTTGMAITTVIAQIVS
jgi:hypothetical protein